LGEKPGISKEKTSHWKDSKESSRFRGIGERTSVPKLALPPTRHELRSLGEKERKSQSSYENARRQFNLTSVKGREGIKASSPKVANNENGTELARKRAKGNDWEGAAVNRLGHEGKKGSRKQGKEVDSYTPRMGKEGRQRKP